MAQPPTSGYSAKHTNFVEGFDSTAEAVFETVKWRISFSHPALRNAHLTFGACEFTRCFVHRAF